MTQSPDVLADRTEPINIDLIEVKNEEEELMKRPC